jgi:hypothetical protein
MKTFKKAFTINRNMTTLPLLVVITDRLAKEMEMYQKESGKN